MITHDNILAEAALAGNEMPQICAKAEQERVLSYLPLSHVAGMLVDIVMPIYMTGNRLVSHRTIVALSTIARDSGQRAIQVANQPLCVCVSPFQLRIL
jgi:long-subunit acyl-CoA synthetase (AMP-forming)